MGMTHIRQRRDTATNWNIANPVLELGEIGWETNTRKAKMGDGVSVWAALPYTVDLSAYATLANPTFTGTVQVPTVATADVTNKAASTAWVRTAIDDKPGVYAGGSQSVANASFTAGTVNAGGGFNSYAMWASGAPDRITCHKAGWYKVTCYVEWAANATGRRQLYAAVSGSYTAAWNDIRTAVAGGSSTGQSITVDVGLAVNDIVQLGLYQDSGGALTTISHHISADWLHL